ncbi:MAG TPA: DUF6785 family protein [Capsulimonadaceae bacterium]|nr:DUF6785 family protein [Capsulimonadaceae bacterium]
MPLATRSHSGCAKDTHEQGSNSPPERSSTNPSIRWRVILFGLLLSLLAFWLVVRMEQVDQTGLPTGLGIYYHAVVILALLAIVNSLFRRFAGRAMVSRPELLCLYSMMSVASSFACFEMLATHLDVISVPARWLALEANQEPIAATILSLLPHWAILHDPRAAVQFYNGRREYPLLWQSWLAPLLFWGSLLALTQAMAGAGCRLLHERWVHQEKLSFPLTALPLELSDPDSHIWQKKSFKIAFSIIAGMDLLNGLHQFYPLLPFVPCKVSWLNQNSTNPAWLAVGPCAITFHPLMLGLAFLFPSDLLFSCWFFYLVGKIQLYVAGSLGLAHGTPFQFGGNFPGLIEQNTGAILMFGLVILRGASGYLGTIWKEARAGDFAHRRDLLLLGLGAIIWALAMRGLGVSWVLIPPFLVIAALLGIVVTRLRAEMGLPVYNLHGQGPEMLLGASFGPQETSLRSLTGLMSLHGILRSQQGNVMPHQMEGAYMAERSGGSLGRYWWAVTIAGCSAALIGPWIYVYTVSVRGLIGHGNYNPFPEEGWHQLAAWAYHPSPPDYQAITLVVVGAAVMLALVGLRRVWPGSPFHPLGYAICGVWGLSMIVMPLFLAWAVKTVVLRYGGLNLYRRAVPVAYGMILGEFVMAVFWAILSILLHTQTYSVWLF